MTELMDRFVELAGTWLWLLLLATWRTLPILVVVTGIGLAFRRKLSPSLHALLWTLVVARLLLPVSVGSPLSLHGPTDNLFSSISGEPDGPVDKQRIVIDHRNSLLPRVDVLESSSESAPVRYAQPLPWQAPAWDEVLFITILATIISVTAGLLFRSVYSHIRFSISLRSCPVLDDQQLIDMLLRECDSVAVGRRPNVREVPSMTAPAVFGLFRKTICLPPNLLTSLTEQELRWVFRHELAHIRRKDIPVMVMASLAGACHWFNPLVWLIVGRLRAAMEAAADRIALQSFSQSEAASYGNLLLRLAQSGVATRNSPTLGLLPFASGKHLQQRVELLMRGSRPRGMMAKSLGALIVAAVALMGLTDAREDNHQKTPEVHFISSAPTFSHIEPVIYDPWTSNADDSPHFLKAYDVDSILNSMPKLLTESGKAPIEQLTAWLPLPSSIAEHLEIEGRTLTADLTAHQHRLLEQTLDAWANGQPEQVTIEARIIQTNVQTASAIDWAGQKLEALNVKGFGPAIAARIQEHDLADLIRAVSADRHGSIMFAPKVTFFDGQTASIADQVQRPFVTGVDPKADGRLQPVISVLDEGLRFVLTPRVGDQDSLTLAFEIRASSVGKVSYANLPIRQWNRTAPHFTVQVPATEQYEVSASVKLAAGESIVVAIPRVFNLEPGADAETTTIVALTPRVIATQEEPALPGTAQ